MSENTISWWCQVVSEGVPPREVSLGPSQGEGQGRGQGWRHPESVVDSVWLVEGFRPNWDYS